MNHDTDIFHIMHTMRALRRLEPDPVPDEMLTKILDAGVCAPSGQNLQRWAFLVVDDTAGEQFFGERYLDWMHNRFGASVQNIDQTAAAGHLAKAAMYLAEHMHEIAVLLFCCGVRDWPFAVPAAERSGRCRANRP